MSLDRVYFPERGLELAELHLLTRPPEHAPTLAEAIAAICSGHGDAS